MEVRHKCGVETTQDQAEDDRYRNEVVTSNYDRNNCEQRRFLPQGARDFFHYRLVVATTTTSHCPHHHHHYHYHHLTAGGSVSVFCVPASKSSFPSFTVHLTCERVCVRARACVCVCVCVCARARVCGARGGEGVFFSTISKVCPFAFCPHVAYNRFQISRCPPMCFVFHLFKVGTRPPGKRRRVPE